MQTVMRRKKLRQWRRFMRREPRWDRQRPFRLSDPADEMVLEVALNGRADGIVTHNVRGFHQAVAKFGIPVLTPSALLERIGK